MAIRACLAKISPLDPATGNRVDIYVSNMNDRIYAPQVNGLGGFTWTPALKAAPLLTMQLWNGDFQAAVDPGLALIPLKMEFLKGTVPAADTYFWIGAPVEVYAETPGAVSWPWPARFVGTVETLERKLQDLTLTASVGNSAHEKEVLNLAYAGTGGAEGGADLKNKLKPLVLGWAQNVEPVLVDTVNNVHQFSGYGAIEAVTTLYERGSAFSASIGDYPTYAALIAAAIPAGRWGTCLALGMIRLGAPAYGVITGDIKGHKVGATTPRLTGAVISALATIAGVSIVVINAASLTALDAAVPYTINIVIRDSISWLDQAKQLALACNWQAGLSLTGTFFVAKVSLTGTEVITLDAQGKAIPLVTSSDERDVSVPYYKTIMGANRAWRVHSADEIATNAALIDKGAYDAAMTYREGNYVTSNDGSQWEYIANTPTAGNAPPTWPTASNTWWDNMIPPLTGTAGSPGLNSATVYLYQRTATNTAPTLPSLSSTYTFAGATLTGHNNGWTQNVPAPAGGAYLWVTTAPAVSTSASVAIANTAWATARLMAQDGATGAAGANSATVTLHRRTATNTAPPVPSTTTTYTFGTGVASGQDGGWTQAVPTAGGGFLWVTTAVAVGTGTTDTIGNTEWTGPSLLAQDGTAGTNGTNGTNGLSGTTPITLELSRQAATVFTYADGTPVDFNNAFGVATVMQGTADITASATLSATMSGGTGQINNTVNQYFTGGKGLYGPQTLATDNATLTISAVVGGVTYTKVMTITKVKVGDERVSSLPGSNLFDGRSVYLTTDRRQYIYNAALGTWQALTAQPAGSNLLVGAIPGTNPNRYVKMGYNPDGMTFDSNATGIFTSFTYGGFPGSIWTTPDQGTFSVRQPNAATGSNGFTDFYMCRPIDLAGTLDDRYPVEVNKTYEFTAYTGAHRCRVDLILAFFNSSNTQLSGGGFSTTGNDWAQAGGVSLSDYGRLSVRAKAPASASYAKLIYRKTHTKTGQTDSYLFVTHPMFAEAPEGGANDLIPWSAPAQSLFYAENVVARSMSGDVLKFGSVTGTEVAATNLITVSAQISNAIITGAKIGNLEVDTLQIKGNAVTATVGAFTAGVFTIGAAYTDYTVQSATTTTITGASLIVMASIHVSGVNSSPGALIGFQMSIYVDGADSGYGPVGITSTSSGAPDSMISVAVPLSLAAGSHTISLVAQATLGGGSIVSAGVTQRSLTLLQGKK